MFQKEAGIASTGLSDDDGKWLQRAGATLFCGVLLASQMHLSSSPLDLASAVTRVVVWWYTESWWPGHLYLSPEVPKSYLLGANLFPSPLPDARPRRHQVTSQLEGRVCHACGQPKTRASCSCLSWSIAGVWRDHSRLLKSALRLWPGPKQVSLPVCRPLVEEPHGWLCEYSSSLRPPYLWCVTCSQLRSKSR